MWPWLITLAIIVILAVLPLGVSAKYDAAGPLVRVIAGPVRLTVFPMKKKVKKVREKKETLKKPTAKDAPAKKKTSDKPEEAQKGGSISDFLPLLDVVLNFLGDLRRKLRVNRLELKLIMTADDPCDLAVNYGRAWAAVGNLMPLLERCFVIKKRNIEVECDFTSDEMLLVARLDLTITLGRIFSLGFRHGLRALREYLKIMNSRKGGALK